MKAIEIFEESGPRSGLRLAELPEPEASHMLTPGEGVVVDVHAAGVSFPELLQSRGMYQLRPPLPFVPGSLSVGAAAYTYYFRKYEDRDGTAPESSLWLQDYGWGIYAAYTPISYLTGQLSLEQNSPWVSNGASGSSPLALRDEIDVVVSLIGRY